MRKMKEMRRWWRGKEEMKQGRKEEKNEGGEDNYRGKKIGRGRRVQGRGMDRERKTEGKWRIDKEGREGRKGRWRKKGKDAEVKGL